MSKTDLIFQTEQDGNSHTRIITQYNSVHQKIGNILAKYWYLLKEDENVAKFITPTLPLPFVVRARYESDGNYNKVKQQIDWETTGIIYLLTCVCGCFYIGKTKRQFRRIADHLYDIRGGRINKPIFHHLLLQHRFDPSVMKFRALEAIP